MSTSLSRRQLLKAGAAMVAAPYFVPATALGKTNRAAPGERITLALIGVGNMGSGHLNSFLGNREVQIVAICDVDRDKRERALARVKEQYGADSTSGTFKGCDLYNEFEEVLARDDIDAVLIAVPDHWHAIIAISACRAGKDVYCEKPLSLTIREAEEMVRAARRYGTVFQTGSQQRSSDNFRYACELVRNGAHRKAAESERRYRRSVPGTLPARRKGPRRFRLGSLAWPRDLAALQRRTVQRKLQRGLEAHP